LDDFEGLLCNMHFVYTDHYSLLIYCTAIGRHGFLITVYIRKQCLMKVHKNQIILHGYLIKNLS